MLRIRAMGILRAFATAKDKPFLADSIAKAAIGKDAEVATSFVSAFAPVVHRERVHVTGVSTLPETTSLSLSRDMKHDIALRYSVGGAATAVMEVVPQHYSRALVEIQRAPETYLPGRALAHASGHYLAAVNEEAKMVKVEQRKAAEEEAKLATQEGAAAGPQRRKSPSKEPKSAHVSAIYSAYVRVEPVHLLMLCDFCYAHDTAAQVWRAPKLSSVLAGSRYGWASPLFSTFRLTSGAESVQLVDGVANPGPNTFASSLWNRLSITLIHLPMVPLVLDDKPAWSKVVTLPEHRMALESAELREWLHYLAHTSIIGGKVEMPPELRASPIFLKSAEMAEEAVRATGYSFSEKEMADHTLQQVREKEEALERERAAAAAALERELAAAAAALEKQLAAAEMVSEKKLAAAEAVFEEKLAAAAAALEKERAAAASMLVDLERLKESGA